MASRIELHNTLVSILGSRNVYFQPPESLKLSYPAIIYSRTKIPTRHANNFPYYNQVTYEVILIDKNPENLAIQKLSKLQCCRYDNHYVSEGLNHDVFTITI